MTVTVLPKGAGLLAGLGVLFWLLAIPYVLLDPATLKDTNGKRIGAWYFLLAEPAGGYSLARTQLLLWFVPTAAMYGALSIPTHQFASIDSTLALLLGMSGGTTLLGAAANPKQANQALGPVIPDPKSPFYPGFLALGATTTNALPPPQLSDVVTDWRGSGDLSRYQYLALSVLGVTVLLLSFLRNAAIPTIPDSFLYLVAASQATYLGTKAVKTVKTDGS